MNNFETCKARADELRAVIKYHDRKDIHITMTY